MRLFILALISFLMTAGCYKEVEDPCDNCRGPEECIDNECILPDNTFKIGDGWVTGHDLYRGINLDCFCVDTLLLNIRPDGLYTVYNQRRGTIGAAVIDVISPDELKLITAGRLCTENGGYHAVINAKFHHDHIDTKLYFFNPNTVPRTFVDSCEMTFFK